MAEVQDFLVGSRTPMPRRRRLLTLVFTDTAASTPRAVDLGDDAWREVLAAHDRDVGTTSLASAEGGQAARRRCPRRVRRPRPCHPMRPRHHGRLRARACRYASGCTPASAAGRRRRARHRRPRRGPHRRAGRPRPDPGLEHGSRPRRRLGHPLRRRPRRRAGRHAWNPQGLPGPAPRRRPEAVRRSAVEQTNLFRRDGEYWTVGYRGLVVTLRDTKGLRDLGRLLAEPGREFHVLDLMADGTGERSIPPHKRPRPGSRFEGWGEPVIDQAPAPTTSAGSPSWNRSSRRPRNGATEKPCRSP